MTWGFYGRSEELKEITRVMSNNRFFFVKITGRRRIGKTTLIQKATQTMDDRMVFYVQIPDSGPAGVLSAVSDAMDTFAIPHIHFARPKTFQELAKLIGFMARAGYITVIDEFQYFNRSALSAFCSYLQAEIDTLLSQSAEIPGGLVVLGSVYTEMAALLEDKSAPLFNRVTHDIELPHLDISSVKKIIEAHSEFTPERLLFLWTLFEGVPKFYRDCYEQDVLNKERGELLNKMFFGSSSPLRSEADNWTLRELRGKYDIVLKYIARHRGCMHGDLLAHVKEASQESSDEQVGSYIKILAEKYKIVDKKLPIFASAKAKKTRYYLADNFLRAWLAAVASQVAAINFRPIDDLVKNANERLFDVEGGSLEKLVATLYQERSRKNIGGFALTRQIEGYWDRKDTELDLVAIDENSSTIRFISCKRSEDRLVEDIPVFDGHVERFLDAFPRYKKFSNIQKVSLAPKISQQVGTRLNTRSRLFQDLDDLVVGL